MARLPLLPVESAEPELKALFDEVKARGIEVPNVYRVLGHAPAMLRAWLDVAWPLRLKAETSRALRELMILRGAQLTDTTYEWAHHVVMARAAGITDGQIAALADWSNSPLFDEREKAALWLAEEVTRGPGASEACMTALSRLFTPVEQVELVLTASFYVCVGRLLKSFAVELEPQFA